MAPSSEYYSLLRAPLSTCQAMRCRWRCGNRPPRHHAEATGGSNGGTGTDDAGRRHDRCEAAVAGDPGTGEPAAISMVRAIRSRPEAGAGNSICSRRPRGSSRGMGLPRPRWPTSLPRLASPCRRSTTIIRARRIWRTKSLSVAWLSSMPSSWSRRQSLATMRERLHLFLSMATDYARRNPDWARLLYLEIWPSVLIEEARVRRAVDDFGRIVVAMIREGSRRGEWNAKLRSLSDRHHPDGQHHPYDHYLAALSAAGESEQGHQAHG